jgi:hypothetical protein
MKGHFLKRVAGAGEISAPGDLRLHVVSSIRLLLQQAVYGLLEWCSKQPTKEGAFLPADLIDDLIAPSDGTLIDALESIAIYCEQLGWSGVTRHLFSPISEEAACRSLCADGGSSVASLLRGLVRLRNDGAEGHGLAGDYDTNAEKDCLAEAVKNLSPLLPRIETADTIVIGPEGSEVRLSFLRLIEGAPVLLRKITKLGSNKLRVDIQYLDGRGRRQATRYEADNFFSSLNAMSIPTYKTWPSQWRPLCYIPERTTETFQGREDEQKALAEWMDDDDSRTCLVYGDGGVGKTTLVVEFLQRYLDGDPDLDVKWKPQVISFYTAKKWRWGINGVELLIPGQPHLMGLLFHLHVLFFGKPPSEDFYRLDVRQAAIKLQKMMADDLGLRRDDHLLIVDNSETLISSSDEIERLGRELREISRRIGRVVITSRRRETLEATPVLVDKLRPLDAVALLKERAQILGLRVIKQAKDEEVLSIVNDLGSSPIVLEAFLQALTDPASRSILAAKRRVSALLTKDLGEFLFADAWARYSSKLKHLLLLLTRIGDVHDGRQLAICCSIVGVTLPEAEEAFEESSGIASLVRLSSGVEVAFSTNFLDFASEKSVAVEGAAHPTATEITEARRQYNQFVQSIRKFSGDRIAQAFRTPLAKAAHRARKDGRIHDALQLYQQAVLSDSNNGWLFDRFAYFLFHDLRDSGAALVQATCATDLIPNEGEVWFTRGLIESRLGDYRRCEASLERAESLGIDRIRCVTQRAWGYLKSSPVMLNLAKRDINFLTQALDKAPRSDRRWAELDALISRRAYLENRGRNVRGVDRDYGRPRR